MKQCIEAIQKFQCVKHLCNLFSIDRTGAYLNKSVMKKIHFIFEKIADWH